MVDPRAKIPVIGQVYGQLTCLEWLGNVESQGNRLCSLFSCSCGTEKVLINSVVMVGKTISCGCARKGKERKDLSGQRFGKLLVTTKFINTGGRYKSLCICDCGEEKYMSSDTLQSGRVVSCGCHGKALLGNATRKHGLSKTPEYQALIGCIARCYNPEDDGYFGYGARGIRVCDSWLQEGGIHNFVSDMGPRHEGTSLDRIDPNGDYCPENCRWANPTIQSFNQNISIKNTSGRTGVYLNNSGNWTARISKEHKHISLGTYVTFEEACKAREEAELKYYGFTKE